jgi:hypothetical protein
MGKYFCNFRGHKRKSADEEKECTSYKGIGTDMQRNPIPNK